MGRVVRCVVVLAVSCVAFAASSSAAGSANPVLTDAARLDVAEQIARSQAVQPSYAAARDARVRSRAAFRELSPRQARETLLARHPSVASRPGWLVLPSVSSAAAARPIGPRVLRVDGGDGPDSLVVTSAPVAFRDKAGKLREIDLGLERTGEDLVTRQSPVDLRLPKTLDEAISVGVGDRRVSITPDVSNGSDAVIEQYSAFYGDVDPDTDFVAKPVVGGVETFSILRSPASPEQLRFRLSGGAGSELRPANLAGGFVLSQGDEDLAFVSTPLAWDAQSRPVSVEATVDGDDLVLQVPHRDRDIAYPIVVDPTTTLSMCWHYISLASGCHVDLWETSTDPKFAAGIPGWAYEGDSRFAQYAGSGGLGTGLYIRNLINNYYNQNEAGDWYYRAPPGVRIHQAMFSNLTQANNSNNMSCLFVGVLNSTGNWEPNAPRTFCAQQTYDAVWTWLPTGNLYSTRGGTEGNAAIFGAMAQGAGWSHYWMDHMGGVALALQEMNHGYLAPWITATDFPDNWQTDPNRFITFHAGDLGLGIRSITFSSPENPGWQPVDYDTGAAANKAYDWCTGGARLTCPRDVWMKLKIGNLRQGFSTIRATVTDMVGKTYTYEHPIAIQYYWASLQYGGSDQSINTPTEITAFLNARNPADNEATVRLWLGASPEDQEHIAAFIEDDAWNPPGIDEDDLTVDGGEDTTDDPAVTNPAEFRTSAYNDTVQTPDGSVVLESTENVDTQAVASSLQSCPSNYVNRRNHKVFRFTRKVSLRVFLNPSTRYHVQINAKPQDIPWVESSVVTTIFTHPDTGRRIKNRVFRPSPGKPAYYAHSNSHVRPGTRLHYDSWVRFEGDGIIIGVYRLPNGTVAIRYLKATGHEGSCLA